MASLKEKMFGIFNNAKEKVTSFLDEKGISLSDANNANIFSIDELQEMVDKYDNSETKVRIDGNEADYVLEKYIPKGKGDDSINKKITYYSEKDNKRSDVEDKYSIVRYRGAVTDKVFVPNYVGGKKIVSVLKDSYKGFENSSAVFCEGIVEIHELPFKDSVFPDSLEYLNPSQSKASTIICPKNLKKLSASFYHSGREYPKNFIFLGNTECWLGGGNPDKAFKVINHLFCAQGCEDIEINLSSLKLLCLTLPETLKKFKIDTSAGSFSAKLPKTISLPEGLKNLSGRFGEGLETINLPSTLEKIADKAFGMCKDLRSIDIPANIKKIPAECFFGCDKLSTVNIANGIEKIGEEAFRGCDSLKSIAIPPSVISIGEKAINKETKIYCAMGSFAHKYAKENSIPWAEKYDFT